MRKGTFSSQRAGANSAAHNSRKSVPKYLLGLENGTENYYKLIEDDKTFIEKAKNIYHQKVGQKMQQKQIPNLVLETVLTLKKEHTENDIKKLFDELRKKYGGHKLLELSIHRDEGHFEKDGITYYPTKNILKKDDGWYISDLDMPKSNDDFNIKVDISTFKKVYNIHAHCKFTMFDESTGRTAHMQKKDMSSRIKFTSEFLGLKYAPGENRLVKKSVNQVKNEHHQKAVIKKVTQIIVKQAISNTKTEMIESQKSSAEDYTKLRELQKELLLKLKAKDLTIEELEASIKYFKNSRHYSNKELLDARETILNQNSTIDTLEANKVVLKQSIEDLEDKTKTLDTKINKYEDAFLTIKEDAKNSDQVIQYVEDLKNKNKQQANTITNLENKIINLTDYTKELEDDFNNKLKLAIEEHSNNSLDKQIEEEDNVEEAFNKILNECSEHYTKLRTKNENLDIN